MYMSDSAISWVVAHIEWVFGALCTVAGGVFAFIKWYFPRTASRRDTGETQISVEGSQNTTALIAAGASVNAPMIVGSNNVQNVTLSPVGEHIPIQQRKPSSPTANEIRHKEETVLQNIPLTQQKDVLKRFYEAYSDLQVRWPIRLYGIQSLAELQRLPRLPQDDSWVVEARYGEESWGAFIGFHVKVSDFPILKTVGLAHRAFIEGRIKRIDGRDISVEVSKLEVE